MMMRERKTENDSRAGMKPAVSDATPGAERSAGEKSRATAAAAMNVKTLGLLMSATSALGPILADGSY